MQGWNESAWFAMWLGVALKSTAVLGAAWFGARLLRRRSAAARHLVWTGVAAALLALTFLAVLLPALPVPEVGSRVSDTGVLFRATALAGLSRSAQEAPLGSSPAHSGR